jgi:plastocyanin
MMLARRAVDRGCGAALVVLAAAVLLTVAGCGQTGEKGRTAPVQGGQPQKPGVRTRGLGSLVGERIQIRANGFERPLVEIRAGQNVIWRNVDKRPHKITKAKGPGDNFEPVTIQPKEAFEHTFSSGGTFQIVTDTKTGGSEKVIVNP